MFPKETSYKLLIQQSIQQLNLASAHIEQLRREMNALASTPQNTRLSWACMAWAKPYGPQLIAEIGDVSRFTHREAITAFAGVDPGVEQSGQHNSKEQQSFQMWNRQAP